MWDLPTPVEDEADVVTQMQDGWKRALPRHHNNSVYCLTVLSERFLVSADDDGWLVVWSCSEGDPLPCCKQRGHLQAVTCVAAMAEGLFATGSRDGSLGLWGVDEASGGAECLAAVQRQGASVHALLCFDAGEGLVCTGAADGRVSCWQLARGSAVLLASAKKHTHIVTHLARVGDALASGSADHSVRLWDARSCRCLHVGSVSSKSITSMVSSSDGAILAVADLSGALALLDGRDLAARAHHSLHSGSVASAHLVGSFVFSVGRDGVVGKTDLRDPQRPPSLSSAGARVYQSVLWGCDVVVCLFSDQLSLGLFKAK